MNGRQIAALTAALAFGGCGSAWATAYIGPNGAGTGTDDPGLVGPRPRAFDWSSNGVRGQATGVRWQHWNSSRTSGKGKSTVCVTMGGCASDVRVTFVASRRHALGEGGSDVVYCRTTIRGLLNPAARTRTVTVTLFAPNYAYCS